MLYPFSLRIKQHICEYMMYVFQFVGVHGFLTVVYDNFPKHLYKTKNKMIVGAVYCSLSFLIGLSMVTEVSVFCPTFGMTFQGTEN